MYHQATDAAESLRKPVWTGTELAAQSFARWWPRCEHSLTTMTLHTQTGKGDTDMPLWNRHNSAVPDYWCDWKVNIWMDHRNHTVQAADVEIEKRDVDGNNVFLSQQTSTSRAYQPRNQLANRLIDQCQHLLSPCTTTQRKAPPALHTRESQTDLAMR